MRPFIAVILILSMPFIPIYRAFFPTEAEKKRLKKIREAEKKQEAKDKEEAYKYLYGK